jgi:hypothetical protein
LILAVLLASQYGLAVAGNLVSRPLTTGSVHVVGLPKLRINPAAPTQLTSSLGPITPTGLAPSSIAPRSPAVSSADQAPAAASSLLDPALGRSPAKNGAEFVNELHQTVKGLWQRFFPRVFVDLDIKPEFSLAEDDEAFYMRLPGKPPVILLESVKQLRRDRIVAKVPAAFYEPSPVKGDISKGLRWTLFYFHEYAHAIFDWKVTAYKGYYSGRQTAFHTLTEGFALSMELALVDKLVEDRAALNLSDADVTSLKEHKRARIESLRRYRDEYTEGTLYYWHALYKRYGYEAVLGLLEHMDIERLALLKKSDTGFRLLQNAPELFVPYLTGQAGDAPWARALDKLARQQVPTEEEMQDLLARAKPRTMARLRLVPLARF